MSIESGIDYGSKEIFAKRYPGLVKLGLTCSWDGIGLMFNKFVSPQLAWGYFRYEQKPIMPNFF